MIKKERGFLTLEIIFAFFVSFSVIILFFGLTLTLTVVEIGQYIVFATSRNYSASHLNSFSQKQEALKKYKQLFNDPYIGRLYRGGWFKLSDEPLVGSFYPQYGEDIYMPFTGVQAQFTANVLKLDFPILGQALGAEENQVLKPPSPLFSFENPPMKNVNLLTLNGMTPF